MKRFILDTNILLGLVRGAEWAKNCYDKYGLAKSDVLVFTSIVSKGELLALAEKLNWGGKKRQEFEKILAEFPSVDISSQKVVEGYAQIKAWTEGSDPPSAVGFPAAQKPAIQMGQNDMWIAATALVSKAVLITTDKDFDHLHGGGVIQRGYVDQKA